MCTFPGCKTKLMFKRKFELQRHMLIHEPKKSFECPVDTCNRRGRYTFYRDDKRRAHLKSVHTDDDYATCPVPGCRIGPLQLDLFRLHLSHHGDHVLNSHAMKSLRRYAEGGQKCPIPKCRQKRWLSAQQLSGPKGHLATHNEVDRTSPETILRENGYDTQGGMICPICSMPSPTHEDFTEHIKNEHVLTEHGKRHAHAARSSKNYLGSLQNWCAWEPLPWPSGENYQCPCCPFLHRAYRVYPDTSHEGLIKPSEELYPYRRQILRLWPNIDSHPVFDDLRRTTSTTT